jgi:Tfp pilus assembly protein PilX
MLININKINNYKYSQGIVIIAVFVTLIILSLISLSIADLTIIDKKTTGNAQYKNEIFRLTEAEIDEQFNFLINNTNILTNALTSVQTLTPQRIPGGCSSAIDECQQAELEFIKYTLPPSGYGIEQHIGYTGALFEINSTASSQSTGAFSSQTSGITIIN